MNVSLYEIAQLVQGKVIGDEKIMISSLSPIEAIAADSLVFADGKNNLHVAETSAAAAILVNGTVLSEIKPIIQVVNPFDAFIQLINHFYPQKKPDAGIHPTAVIAPDAMIGKNVRIGPYVTIDAGAVIGDFCDIRSHVSIGAQVTIGEASVLYPHVSIYAQSKIGARVYIHASSVIGCDGFGYTFAGGQHKKIPHVGHVIIEDDVEIGANTVIDRATLGTTVIGAGTKIDNLVQVAHSVKLGKHNILCAFTGIAGSTVSGERVIFAANVGVSDHVRIDDGVILGARTGVPPNKHLKEGNVYLGNPARPKEKAIEHELSVTRIPFMRKNLNSLAKKVAALSRHLSTHEVDE